MSLRRVAPLLVAGLIHSMPWATRIFQAPSLLPAGPTASVLRWVVGALAVAGTYHAVSAGSAVLLSATQISGTVGTRLSYQIKINDGQNRLAESWVVAGQIYGRSGSATNGLPPGLALALSTGIISGLPTQGGTFVVPITAYEYPSLGGGKLSFTLTFTISGGLSPPSITTQPAGGTATEGGSFTFFVAATGAGTLSYQWQHDGVNVAGATASRLTLTPLTLSDAGSYKVIVANSAGSVPSASATLNVTALPPSTPSILTPPLAATVHAGERVTLTVSASSGTALTYQWRLNGTDIPTATGASLTIDAAAPTDAGNYQVRVSNASGSVLSDSVAVEVIFLQLKVSLTPDNVSLEAQTIPGRQYAFEATDTIDSGWASLSDVTAEGSTTLYEGGSLIGKQRFWRVRALAPH